MKDEKKMEVKKGWLAVQVGLEDEDGGFQRFSIPISYLYHPLFQNLLDKAREVYDYNTSGFIRGGELKKKQPFMVL
ncbi:auxin-induced protein 6b [Phtheirospermum japonicum]|uniref:Auxin-induced protein 6b n=1 Tax=Phtheirospermum japonicum TaxID=374723 RepID=A0A830DN24_9LAMI|nr:auxin-induced protein 6b [Phtheirospermum japonicum]